jgi:uncharacterized protein YrrD
MLLNSPIISLRNGGRLGETTGFVINPKNLKIEALYCDIPTSKSKMFLLTQDIRDISQNGILINDYADLSEADDLIRLKRLIESQFTILDKPVVTVNKDKLGKVKDYAIDSGSLFVHKLYVIQPIYKDITGKQLVIDRSQIIEVTNSKIIVKEVFGSVKIEKTISTATIPNIA